ncbi:ABC transporter permease [Candidatus Chlorohelix allophototropha]|uniref:ABC transporter permease n=1 Tax=Candidatus Chlorohelix allophototropha TaxID=3003348 RepID=A0ABY9B5M4_9CHLR|nr:ABC transporter permease [Chloroflexota bacterium L227-S17]
MAQTALKIGNNLKVSRWLRKYTIWMVLAAVVPAVFIWRSAVGQQPVIDTFSVIIFTLAFSTPITLGALSGTFSERSGVVNIAIEGMMLSGAYFGALFTKITGEIWIGFLAAIVVGGLLALFHGALSIYFRVDQIISGTVINIFAFGLTSFLHSLTKKTADATPSKLPSISFKVENTSFTLGFVTILGIVAIFVGHYVLFKTRWGLRTRAVGENPKAADTAGINVFKVRYINVVISGMLAGTAGTYFSLQVLGGFTEGMTVGTGFIALAAMIFGNWNPLNAWGAALIFGLCITADSLLQSWYGNITWLHTITQAIPYVVTIVVVAGVIGRSRPPAAVGTPYTKQ